MMGAFSQLHGRDFPTLRMGKETNSNCHVKFNLEWDI